MEAPRWADMGRAALAAFEANHVTTRESNNTAQTIE